MPDAKQQTGFWDGRRRTIRSVRGGWTIGSGISNCGYSMLDDLVGKASFFQVLVLNVTGRLPEQSLAEWLEATFICLSWPDSRIWCNHIGALAGDARVAPTAAVCAGAMASDSSMYGPGTVLATVQFLESARTAVNGGASIEEFISNNAVRKGRLIAPGFARPIATGDERVAAMQRIADGLGFTVGPLLDLAYVIDSHLREAYGESINLGGYMCAFMRDQGYTATEGYRLYSLCVNSGVHACYSEYRDKAAGGFLPLRCDDVEYIGPEERRVPTP